MFVIENQMNTDPRNIESLSLWLNNHIYFIEHVLVVCVDCEPVGIHTHTHTALGYAVSGFQRNVFPISTACFTVGDPRNVESI